MRRRRRVSCRTEAIGGVGDRFSGDLDGLWTGFVQSPSAHASTMVVVDPRRSRCVKFSKPPRP
jgi:hypothetical protein